MASVLRLLQVIPVVALLAASWGCGLPGHPDVSQYDSLRLADAPARPRSVRATFFGVSTILFDDGETAIMSDGFFTRPNSAQLFATLIAPDRTIIAESLRRAGVTRLAAVFVNHSHFDHVMDAPEVAMQTGAVLVGSPSTANVGRGWGLPEDRIRTVRPGDQLTFGRFKLTVLPSRHLALAFATGEITEPLRPPAHATAYREGGSYAYLIEYGGRSILINASAGYQPGALAGRHADVVYLGVGQLGRSWEGFRDGYWREMVSGVGARRVIPVHWDDFALPLDQPLQPMSAVLDNFDGVMQYLRERGAKENVDVRLPVAWQAVNPFEGL